MRAYFAFVKKELLESVRTYKLMLVLIVFLLFGMLNPITAKITPELMASFMPEGMNITIPEPSASDAWVQFYKNMPLQIVVFMILFSGMIANEISGGTLVNMLTKGLKRGTVILSKLTVMSIIWTVAYYLCFFITYGYTLYLLPGDLPHLFFSSFCMWLFGILLIVIMLLGGALFANIYGSLLLTGGSAVALMLLNIVPKLQKWNPMRLSSDNMGLLMGQMTTTDFRTAALVTVALFLVLLAGTLVLFNRRKV